MERGARARWRDGGGAVGRLLVLFLSCYGAFTVSSCQNTPGEGRERGGKRSRAFHGPFSPQGPSGCLCRSLTLSLFLPRVVNSVSVCYDKSAQSEDDPDRRRDLPTLLGRSLSWVRFQVAVVSLGRKRTGSSRAYRDLRRRLLPICITHCEAVDLNPNIPPPPSIVMMLATAPVRDTAKACEVPQSHQRKLILRKIKLTSEDSS